MQSFCIHGQGSLVELMRKVESIFLTTLSLANGFHWAREPKIVASRAIAFKENEHGGAQGSVPTSSNPVLEFDATTWFGL